MNTTTAPTCTRCCEWLSLQLDGSLSEIEARIMRRHLASCRSCAQFAEATASITQLLRTADLESIGAPIQIPTHRPELAIARRLTTLLVVAITAATLTTTGPRSTAERRQLAAPANTGASSELISMRTERRRQLLTPATSTNPRARVIEID